MQTIITKHRFASILKFAAVLGLSSLTSVCHAGEPHQWFAGTYLDPAIQRPDLFPHTITRSIPEHRQVYNRPRNLTGWIAYKIEPSSQEAMAWQTNHCNGNYQNNAGAYVPMYCYPKPWESLNTRGRPGWNPQGQSTGSRAEVIDGTPFEPGALEAAGPVESIPSKKLKAVPEQNKNVPSNPIGVEVPPPSAGLPSASLK